MRVFFFFSVRSKNVADMSLRRCRRVIGGCGFGWQAGGVRHVPLTTDILLTVLLRGQDRATPCWAWARAGLNFGEGGQSSANNVSPRGMGGRIYSPVGTWLDVGVPRHPMYFAVHILPSVLANFAFFSSQRSDFVV